MALRHKYACQAIENTDLLALATFYTESIKECLSENKSPYLDGACRLIAFQIALIGNGDRPFYDYYQQVAEYCLKRMNYDELGLTGKVFELNEPEFPKAS